MPLLLTTEELPQTPTMSRVAASTALRSVILAATACSGAASAATSAADELAELRKDFRRSVEQREARRSSSAPYLGFSRSYLKERDPESFARVEEQNQAAQERAEAALKGHRQTRFALRQPQAARKDAEGGEATDTVERSRRETAAAITKTAEVRTELAATQLELAEEQQARRRLGEEAEALTARIRQTQAEAAVVRSELDGTRASEAASLTKIREELKAARTQILSEVAAAERAREASRGASAAVAAAATEVAEARVAQEQEALAASSLQRSLDRAQAEAAKAKSEFCDQQVDASARVIHLEHAEAEALTALSRDSMQHELSEMLVARREQAARRLVSSLLASSFEGFLRTALRAWRKAKDDEPLASEAQEAVLQRREIAELRAELAAVASCPDCGSIYLADAAFCRHCGRPREDEDALASATAEADALRRQVESLTSEAHAAVDKAKEAEVELERARSKEATLQEGLRNAQSREASNSELMQQQLADIRSTESLCLEKLRIELRQARTEAQQSRNDAQEAALAAQVAAEEAANCRAREVNSIASMQQRLSYTAEEVATARAEVAVRQVRLEQLEEQQEHSELAASEVVAAACGHRAAEVSRRVIAGLMASNLEAFLHRTLLAWREAAEAQSLAAQQSKEEDALRAELEELRGQLKASTAAAVSAEALRSKDQLLAEQRAKDQESLRSQLQLMQDELAAAKAAVVASEKSRSEDRLLADKESQENASMRSELDNLRRELDAAKAAASKSAGDLQTKADLAAKHEQEVAALRAEMEELRASLQAKSPSQTEAVAVSSADLKVKDQELQILAQAALESQVSAMALAQREEASRRVVASLLSSRLLDLMKQALRAWRWAFENSKEIAAANTEADTLRLSMAALEQDLASAKEDLRASAAETTRRSAHVMALTRREEALQQRMSSLMAAQMEGLVRSSFRAWRAVQMREWSEQSEALAARSELLELQKRLDESACQQALMAAAAPAQALAVSPLDAADPAESLCWARQAEVAQRVIASLLSSRIEAALKAAFSAWQAAQAMALESAQAGHEAEQLRLLLRSAQSDLTASQELSTARADEVQALTASLAAARSELQAAAARSSERSNQKVAQETDATAAAAPVVLMRCFNGWYQRVASRREKLLRRVLSSWAASAHAARASRELSGDGGPQPPGPLSEPPFELTSKIAELETQLVALQKKEAGAREAAVDSSCLAVEQLALLRFFERRELALSKAFAGLLGERLQDFLANVLREWRHCADRSSSGDGDRSPLPQVSVQFEAQIQATAATLELGDRYISSRQTSKSSTGAAAAAWDRYHEMDMDSEPEL